MLESFPQDDRDHMVENGKISVTCEFCSSTYVFAPDEVAAQSSEQGSAQASEQRPESELKA